MANSVGSFEYLFDGASISGTGVSTFAPSIPDHCHNVGILVNIDSGTVAALTVNLQHKVGDTWTNVTGAQTTNTSGGAIAFASVPTIGEYRANIVTCTTPSSLVITAKVVFSNER